MTALSPTQRSATALPGGYHDVLATRCPPADDAIETVNSAEPFDAHVRLSADEFDRLQPTHLHSGIDDDPLSDEPAPSPAASPPVFGYTEWTAPGPRTLSMGWDWSVDRPGESLPRAQWESLRTNVMLVGPDGGDLGPDLTREAVARLMSRIGWERVAARAVALPTPPPH